VCCLDQAAGVAGKAISQAAALFAGSFLSSASYKFANSFLALGLKPFVLMHIYFRRNCVLFPTAFQLSIGTATAAFSDI